jgi:hypothetical protein
MDRYYGYIGGGWFDGWMGSKYGWMDVWMYVCMDG